jgi:hypothetical protein
MLDPTYMYPNSFHPVKNNRSRDLRKAAEYRSRREQPPKYYLIDFGISRRYRLEERPPLEPIIVGGDRTAPEHRGSIKTCDPFPTDVYYIGNMVRTNFLQVNLSINHYECHSHQTCSESTALASLSHWCLTWCMMILNVDQP